MSPGLALAIVALLIAGNALFVAAEFALVGSSRGAINAQAEAGDRGARRAAAQLSNLSFVLSACQFGITATSLLVGFLAEDAIGDVVVRPVVELLGLPAATATGVSIAVALLLSTMLQMVVGELAPKNLAIARPEGTATATSGPVQVFAVVFGPIIRLFDSAAAWLTRHVFRVEVTEELGSGLSMEELSRIIDASGEEGMLSDGQTTILSRTVRLRDRRVDDVMLPRPDVTWVEADQVVAELRTVARESGHSRFPVRDGDRVVGTVHVKDLMAVPVDLHQSTTMAEIAAPTLLVSGVEPARGLLARFRGESRTFAVVVDEYGDVVGVVTMEDVLEQLVGQIEDEHDPSQSPGVTVRDDGTILVAGRLPVERMPEAVGIDLPAGDYETLAGFVIEQFGGIPAVGDRGSWNDHVFEVTAMDGARIDVVLVTPAAGEDDADDGADEAAEEDGSEPRDEPTPVDDDASGGDAR